MEVLEKIEALLQKAFPPPDKVDLQDVDGIFGTIVSDRFAGLRTLDRLHMIWDVLDQNLTPEERRRVAFIVASTPEDEIAYSA